MSADVLAELIKGLWTNVESILVIVLRTVAVYVALFIGIRLMGKREVGQMTPFDLVLILLLANAVQNAMVGPDSSLVGGLCAAGVLLALNRGVDRLARGNPRFGRMLRGSACVLVRDGVILEKSCSSEGVDREDIEQSMREHGVSELSEVKQAVLEVDGTISILKTENGEGASSRRGRRKTRGRK